MLTHSLGVALGATANLMATSQGHAGGRLVSTAQAERVTACIDSHIDDWIAFYKTAHANPELSNDELETARRVADAFHAAGIETTREFGGHGVVGLIRNGEGPVILIRGDIDALPITEETGLDYASRRTVTRPDGTRTGVMHACGHDMHQTVLIATARTLSALRSHWRGTVVFVAQPAEEIGQGARRMIEAGLFTKFPKPRDCIALHCAPQLMAGMIGVTPGNALANVDSINITVHGRGGHGAYPHESVDPIVAGSQLVLALQTIVSRRIDPREPAVITVGSFHAGSKHNVIPDEARLQLTVRSYGDDVRAQLLEAIRQVAVETCKAAGCEKPPTIEVVEADFTPSTYNDPTLAAHAIEVFRDAFGAPMVITTPPVMGGEDFGRYAPAAGARGLIYWLGILEPTRFAASRLPGAEPLPPLHSSKLQVAPEPTIRTGVRAMSHLALSLLASADEDGSGAAN